MTEERAMLAFKLKEPVTVVLRDATFNGRIKHIITAFRDKRALLQLINGEDRELTFSFCVVAENGHTPYIVSADQLTTDLPDSPEEYKETILKSLVGLR